MLHLFKFQTQEVVFFFFFSYTIIIFFYISENYNIRFGRGHIHLTIRKPSTKSLYKPSKRLNCLIIIITIKNT